MIKSIEIKVFIHLKLPTWCCLIFLLLSLSEIRRALLWRPLSWLTLYLLLDLFCCRNPLSYITIFSYFQALYHHFRLQLRWLLFLLKILGVPIRAMDRFFCSRTFISLVECLLYCGLVSQFWVKYVDNYSPCFLNAFFLLICGQRLRLTLLREIIG